MAWKEKFDKEIEELTRKKLQSEPKDKKLTGKFLVLSSSKLLVSI